jgi:O-antigen/teichoic acid export membrane protein
MQNYRTATQLAAATLNFFLNLWLIPTWGWHGAAWSSLCTDAALAAMNWGTLRIQLNRSANA